MVKVLLCSRVSLFPPEHDGAKNFRCIARKLAAQGAKCRVIMKMHSPNSQRQRFGGQHLNDLIHYRKISHEAAHKIAWTHEGVEFYGVYGHSGDLASELRRMTGEFNPDVVALSDDALDDDDKLFQVGVETDKLFFFAQTLHGLPFGPYAIKSNPETTKVLFKAKKILVPSFYSQQYIELHLGRSAQVYYPDILADPPFSRLGQFENPFVTMINPCPWKGSSIFIKLARSRPDLGFAAVLGWGADETIAQELSSIPNVTIFPVTQSTDEIFSKTKVLLVPSLYEEAFDSAVPEALIRGIPVIASDIGGLKESTLGVARLIPIEPGAFARSSLGQGPAFVWSEPENPVEAWSDALNTILDSQTAYHMISNRSRVSAESFFSKVARQSAIELLYH